MEVPRSGTAMRYGPGVSRLVELPDEGRVIAAAKGRRDWASEGAMTYIGELLGGPAR